MEKTGIIKRRDFSRWKTNDENTAIKKALIQMNILFRAAYEGHCDTDFLYRKGTEIREKLEERVEDFWTEGKHSNLEDLKDAFEFIYQLHDAETRDYTKRHKEEVYYYHVRLGKIA